MRQNGASPQAEEQNAVRLETQKVLRGTGLLEEEKDRGYGHAEHCS